jgi:hypothetical protein
MVTDPDELAKLLVGRPGRLKLAAWIIGRDDNLFYQHQAVLGTRCVQSEVRIGLEHFVRLGLIAKIPRDRQMARQQFYERRPSPFWHVYRAALQAMSEWDASVTAGPARTGRAHRKNIVRLRRTETS